MKKVAILILNYNGYKNSVVIFLDALKVLKISNIPLISIGLITHLPIKV